MTNKIKDGIIYVLLAILGIGAAIVKIFFRTKGETPTEEVIRLKRERVELHEKIKAEQDKRKENDAERDKRIEDVKENRDPDNVIDFFNKRYGADDDNE